MEHTHDAVVRVIAGGGGIRTPKERTSTSTGSLDDVRNIPARNDGTRLEHGLPLESSVCSQISRVAPGWPSMLKKHSGSLRLGADALVNRVAAVVGYAVHAEEPAVLAVDEHQLAGVVLHARIAGRHIVAYRLDLTGGADVQVVFSPVTVLVERRTSPSGSRAMS